MRGRCQLRQLSRPTLGAAVHRAAAEADVALGREPGDGGRVGREVVVVDLDEFAGCSERIGDIACAERAIDEEGR